MAHNDHKPHAAQTLRKLWDKGIEPKVFCLHAEREHDAPLPTVIRETKPFAIAHHGGVTDAKFRQGKSPEVRDFVKKVKDQHFFRPSPDRRRANRSPEHLGPEARCQEKLEHLGAKSPRKS